MTNLVFVIQDKYIIMKIIEATNTVELKKECDFLIQNNSMLNEVFLKTSNDFWRELCISVNKNEALLPFIAYLKFTHRDGEILIKRYIH
jgi:hypothetical protein